MKENEIYDIRENCFIRFGDTILSVKPTEIGIYKDNFSDYIMCIKNSNDNEG